MTASETCRQKIDLAKIFSSTSTTRNATFFKSRVLSLVLVSMPIVSFFSFHSLSVVFVMVPYHTISSNHRSSKSRSMRFVLVRSLLATNGGEGDTTTAALVAQITQMVSTAAKGQSSTDNKNEYKDFQGIQVDSSQVINPCWSCVRPKIYNPFARYGLKSSKMPLNSGALVLAIINDLPR